MQRNMRYFMKRTILLFAVAITIASCTEKVELELGELTEPRLVVEGWITDQVKPHRVRLTTSRSYFENQPAPVISGAHVTIDDGEQTVVLQEQPAGSGEYFTPPDHAGQVGRLYRLRIEHDGESWEATDMMRPVPPIDSIAFEPATNGFGNNTEEGYYVRIWTHELPGLGDHYRWKSWVNGESRSDSLKAASFTDDALYDGAQVAGVIVDWIRAVPGDTVRVEQHAISKQAYDVILAILMNTEWRGGIFDPPPANVPSNISNGGFGFFGAASVKERTAIVP
jgi:hypothetical protein